MYFIYDQMKKSAFAGLRPTGSPKFDTFSFENTAINPVIFLTESEAVVTANSIIEYTGRKLIVVELEKFKELMGK